MTELEQPANGHAYRQQLRRAVEDDIARLVDGLHRALVEELPDYEAGANDAEDVRAAVKRSARLVLGSIFGDEIGSAERAIWRVIGAQRARGGFRREALAAAPAVAMRRGFDFILDKSTAIPAPGPLAAAVLRDVWTRLVTETSGVADALVAGYDEQRGLDLSESTRPQLALVDRLLSRLWEDRDEIVERGRRLGVDVTCPHGALVLIACAQSPATLAAAAKDLLRQVPQTLEGPCRTAPQPHLVLLVPSRPEQPWRDALLRIGTVAARRAVTVVVIDPVEPVGPLEARYRQALRFLTAMPAATSTPCTLTLFDLEYHWLLNRAPVDERVNVVRTILGPILDTAKVGQLLDMLDALYETRAGVAGAARALEVHPNTINKWKAKVHDLTGLSLDVPADAHRLFTARRLHKVLVATGGGLVPRQASL